MTVKIVSEYSFPNTVIADIEYILHNVKFIYFSTNNNYKTLKVSIYLSIQEVVNKCFCWECHLACKISTFPLFHNKFLE